VQQLAANPGSGRWLEQVADNATTLVKMPEWYSDATMKDEVEAWSLAPLDPAKKTFPADIGSAVKSDSAAGLLVAFRDNQLVDQVMSNQHGVHGAIHWAFGKHHASNKLMWSDDSGDVPNLDDVRGAVHATANSALVGMAGPRNSLLTDKPLTADKETGKVWIPPEVASVLSVGSNEQVDLNALDGRIKLVGYDDVSGDGVWREAAGKAIMGYLKDPKSAVSSGYFKGLDFATLGGPSSIDEVSVLGLVTAQAALLSEVNGIGTLPAFNIPPSTRALFASLPAGEESLDDNDPKVRARLIEQANAAIRGVVGVEYARRLVKGGDVAGPKVQVAKEATPNRPRLEMLQAFLASR
jgi:hypothetical protein